MNKDVLAQELKKLDEVCEKLSIEIQNDKETLVKIESEPKFSIFRLIIRFIYYYIVIGLVFLAIMLFGVEFKATWCFWIVVFFTLKSWVVNFFIKAAADVNLEENGKKLQEAESKFDDLVDTYLIQEINPLGMMTTQNIIDRTSAKFIRQNTVVEIMDREVRKGKFDRVLLHNNQVLYKSKQPQAMDNIETVVLEID